MATTEHETQCWIPLSMGLSRTAYVAGPWSWPRLLKSHAGAPVVSAMCQSRPAGPCNVLLRAGGKSWPCIPEGSKITSQGPSKGPILPTKPWQPSQEDFLQHGEGLCSFVEHLAHSSSPASIFHWPTSGAFPSLFSWSPFHVRLSFSVQEFPSLPHVGLSHAWTRSCVFIFTTTPLTHVWWALPMCPTLCQAKTNMAGSAHQKFTVWWRDSERMTCKDSWGLWVAGQTQERKPVLLVWPREFLQGSYFVQQPLKGQEGRE